MAPKTTKKRTGTTPSSCGGAESLLLSNKNWRVGRLLGQGAQACVHELIDIRLEGPNGAAPSPDFVVKVAPLPEALAPPKRKKSLMEINADSLNGEWACYNALRAAQGVRIPRLPPIGADAKTSPFPPIRGDIVVDGKAKFRFLVIEKMDAPIFALVDRLLMAAAAAAAAAARSSKKKSAAASGAVTTASLGPVFAHMIDTVKDLHAGGQLLVDVKADNWMLRDTSANEATGKKAPATSSVDGDAAVRDLAATIRCLDLALARPYVDYTRVHRPDVVGDGVQVGTPLYASVHVHEGHTPSRRDDLFSVGIIMGELLIRLQAQLLGTDHLYQPSVAAADPSYLPWAKATSEKAMGMSMKAHLFDKKSEFYTRLPEAAAPVLHAYLGRVHAVEYDKKPPYAALVDMVQNLPVALGGSNKTAEARATRASSPSSSSGKLPAKKKPRGSSSAAAVPVAAAGLKPPPTAQTMGSAAVNNPGAASDRTTPSSPPLTSRARPTRTARAAAANVVAAPSATAKAKIPMDDLTARAVASVAPRRRGGKRPAANASPGEEAKKVGRREAAAAAKPKDDADASGDGDDDDMDVDESFCTAQTSPGDGEDEDSFEPMEVDDDEVEFVKVVPAPAARPKKAKASKASNAAAMGLEVAFTGGPMSGTSYLLADGPGGHPRCLVVGSSPPRTVGKDTVSVKVSDPGLAPAHAKLSLVVMKSGVRAIEVKNMSTSRGGGGSGSGSLHIDGTPVPKTMHAFPGARITMGSTVLTVVALGGPVASSGKENAVRRGAAAKASRSTATPSSI